MVVGCERLAPGHGSRAARSRGHMSHHTPPHPVTGYITSHRSGRSGWTPTLTARHTCLLKRNKYVGILSIAVTTLQYITISMITIFSMYIAHVR